jgi:prepilin-type N-terminal cleavage/methylation domain-containing protein
LGLSKLCRHACIIPVSEATIARFIWERIDFMNKAQRGFTLIELVMVIVILGVLAAVAIPKFVDLKTDAYQASAKGYAGALSSANAINYAGCAQPVARRWPMYASPSTAVPTWGPCCNPR